MVSAAGAIVSAATLVGFLGSAWWLFDLFAHFRVQYFLALAAVSLGLLLLKKRRAAACFGLPALLNLITILPFFFGGHDGCEVSFRPYRAVLANVNTRFGDVERVGKFILTSNAHIVVLEEVDTKWISKLAPAMQSYPHRKLWPRDDNFGIALYSRLPLRKAEICYVGEAGVPSMRAVIETPDGPLIIWATHPLPPSDRENSRLRNDQLTKLSLRVFHATSPVLLLGDLNVTPWSSHFSRFLKQSGLQDSSRGKGLQPTWPSNNPLLLIPLGSLPSFA